MRKAIAVVMLALTASACRPLPMYTVLEVPKRQVADLRADPEMRGLVQDVAREGMKSAVGAIDEQATAQLRALFLEMTRALVAELKAIIADALAGLEPQAQQMTTALVEGTVSSMSEQLPRALGPAMRGFIVDELLEKPEFRRALDDTSRDIGKQAVLGANDAMIELARARQHGADAPLGVAGRLLSTQGWLAGGIVIAAAVSAALVLWQRRRMHLAEREAERHRALATALIASVDLERVPPDVRKLIEAERAGDEPTRRRPTLRHA
jgi:hypothetical protein